MNNQTDREHIINSIPSNNYVLVYLMDGAPDSVHGRRATYEQVVDRLEENGARRPPRQTNRLVYRGKLVAEGIDEAGLRFWVSAERPDLGLEEAWS